MYASYVHIICWVYVRALREKFAAKFKVNQSVWCSVSTTQCIVFEARCVLLYIYNTHTCSVAMRIRKKNFSLARKQNKNNKNKNQQSAYIFFVQCNYTRRRRAPQYFVLCWIFFVLNFFFSFLSSCHVIILYGVLYV